MLTTAEKDLARFVGPLAKLLVRKAAAQTSDVGELYTILSTKIGDPQERRRFIAEPHAAEAIASTSRAGQKAGGRAISTGGGATDPSSEPTRTAHSGRTTVSRPPEPAFVEATVARLAVYLGPIAKLVAKKAALQAKSPEEFVQIVASYIGTQDRKAFLREMGIADE